ncbi:MAG: hypothetical protein MI863_06750 [Desulfobacterales bacterium]|nr:hypothetical protein [Desulfobacterales bacterium]
MRKLKVILIVYATLMCSVTFAADWNFYGSARVNTFYTKFDKSPFSPGTAALGLATGNDTSNYEQKLHGNARIGARVSAGETLSGRFEYGALGGSANLRLLFGEWNFGAGSLRVGKSYSPLVFPCSNQVFSINSLGRGDHHMTTWGQLYGGRKTMIRLKFGGFQIAAVEPDTLVSLTESMTGAGTQQPDTEIRLPRIQAKYKYDLPRGWAALAGAYQNFNILSSGEEHSVSSWLVGLGGRLNLGPAYLKGNIYGGQNVGNHVQFLVNGNLWSTTGNAGTGNFDGDGFGLARWDGSTVVDRDAVAGLIVAGLEIRKGLYVETGYGYVKSELDGDGFGKDDAATYYVQSTIFLAPGVSVTPEIGRCDMKQSDDPVITYAGIKWQINF